MTGNINQRSKGETMANKKPTIKKAREFSRFGSWLDFKHKLMDYLNIDRSESMKWNVPQEWINCFKKANR
jgi:hypothetical protein